MSDFSLFSLFTAGLACMVPFASAYTTPVGAEPKGNPIYQPNLNSIVPAGKGFTITWEPTTEGPVTLVLLKGPATDLKLANVIVEGTENDGSYVWTPSTDIEPTAGDTGYGIQLIVDSGANKGQYQYTTQFGISNPDYKEGSSSSSSSSAKVSMTHSSTLAAAPAYGSHSTSSSEGLKTASASGYPSFYSAPTAMYPIASANHTVMPTGGAVKPTGWMSASNTTMVAPTGMVPSSTLRTSSTGTGASATAPTESVPVSTGAASTMTTSFFSLVLAAGVAIFAY